MIFLDPAEAKRIKELLDCNQPVAAAELLGNSAYKDHSSVRPLVTRCLEQLVEAAATLFKDGQIETALKHIRLASDLRPLSGKSAALKLEIEAAAAERQECFADRDARLSEARRLADSGRLHTAFEVVEPIISDPSAGRLASTLEAKLKTCQRLKDELKQRLDCEDLRGAEVILKKLRELDPSSAGVHQLARDVELLRKKVDGVSSAAPASPPQTVCRHDRGVILDFAIPKLNTLVLFGNTAVIGAAASSGTTADIPVAGVVLHRQHAIILRHQRDGRMKYWLMSHPSHSKGTTVTRNDDRGRPNAITISGDGPNNAMELNDSDVISMANEEGVSTVQFVFRQRQRPIGSKQSAAVAMNDTAILECFGSSTWLDVNNTQCCRVVLLHDSLTIGSDPTRNDILVARFPVRTLTYKWKRGQMTIEVDNDNGGDILWSLDEETRNQDIRYGTRLSLQAVPGLILAPEDRPLDIRIFHCSLRNS